MSDVRRDLAGLTVISQAGHEAVVQKGGFVKLDGSLEVRFLYRGEMQVVTLPDAAASGEEVRAAIVALLPQLDEALDLLELLHTEVSV